MDLYFVHLQVANYRTQDEREDLKSTIIYAHLVVIKNLQLNANLFLEMQTDKRPAVNIVKHSSINVDTPAPHHSIVIFVFPAFINKLCIYISLTGSDDRTCVHMW